MKLLDEYNAIIKEMYQKDEIDSTDLRNVAEYLGMSYFTIYQYAKGNGNSISTAESIYRAFKDIVDTRKRLIEKQEILNDYSN